MPSHLSRFLSLLVVGGLFCAFLGTDAAAQSLGRFLRVQDPIPGQYIVVLARNLTSAVLPVEVVAKELTDRFGGTVLQVYPTVLRGFVARMSEAQALAMSADARVEYVAEDGRTTAPAEIRRVANPASGRYTVALVSDSGGLPAPLSDSSRAIAEAYGGAVSGLYPDGIHGFELLAPESVAAAISLDPRVLYVSERDAASKTKFRLHVSGKRGRYVVAFTAVAAGELGRKSRARGLVADLQREHGGTILHVFEYVLNGFAVELDEAVAVTLSQDQRVEYVIEDGTTRPPAVQSPAGNWALDRIDQRARPLNNSYAYQNTGAGVNVYLVDTGVLASHAEFGGRATVAFDVTGGDGTDCFGHGTPVASLVGGATVGVARAVSLHAVKVYSGCDGLGSWSDFIAGVQWVAANRVFPALAVLEIHSEQPYQPLDTAVQDLVAAGVPAIAAAGNFNRDVSSSSPGRVAEVITVGAVSETDTRTDISNFGPGLDVFAPGQNIMAAHHSWPNYYTYFGGTSAATPLVAGVAALYLENNPGATPASVHEAIIRFATVNAVGDPGYGTPNRLLYTAEADVDADGMPDWWEMQFGLSSTSSAGGDGPNGDPDGDGLTNVQEYGARSHPRGTYRAYFAEGSNDSTFFETHLSQLNTGGDSASTTVRLLRSDGLVVTQFQALPAMSRQTINSRNAPALVGRDFSTAIESDRPIVADRTMYWTTGQRYGTHTERAVQQPSTLWYLAEGATHSGFQLYILIQNPHPVGINVEVKYVRPAPAAPLFRTYSLVANSRFTIHVNSDTALVNSDVSAEVSSTMPIIVERAMYKDSQQLRFGAGHASAAVSAPQMNWFFAEGATGSLFDMYLLLANFSIGQANVLVEYLLSDGTVVPRSYSVGPNSRVTIHVDLDAALNNRSLSARVTSTNGVPIVAERSMWWPGNYSTWHEGHNSPGSTVTGRKWAFADGETGGLFGAQTYILIANTSPWPDAVTVTLLRPDGTSTLMLSVPANSRTNVEVGPAFGFLGRFGAVVESMNAQIVVERAVYSNSAAGVSWAAGAASLATRLQ